MATSTDPDIRLLQALADPVRLTIVRELAGQPEVCACDFTSCCDVTQPTISHHLKVLREAGVIEGERRGTLIVYRLRRDAAARLAAIAGMMGAAEMGATTVPSGRDASRVLPVLNSI